MSFLDDEICAMNSYLNYKKPPSLMRLMINCCPALMPVWIFLDVHLSFQDHRADFVVLKQVYCQSKSVQQFPPDFYTSGDMSKSATNTEGNAKTSTSYSLPHLDHSETWTLNWTLKMPSPKCCRLLPTNCRNLCRCMSGGEWGFPLTQSTQLSFD